MRLPGTDYWSKMIPFQSCVELVPSYEYLAYILANVVEKNSVSPPVHTIFTIALRVPSRSNLKVIIITIDSKVQFFYSSVTVRVR